jgi:pteridine reductase
LLVSGPATSFRRMEMPGKVAVVTGGARRLGRELVLALARGGADVVVNYNRSRDAAEALCGELRTLGRRTLAVQGDVASKAAVERLIAATDDAFGRLDILVNSASTFESEPLLEITEAAWDRVMAVNLKGPFLVAQAAVPLIRRNGGGVIVNLADLAGLQPWTEYAHHSVSKAGLIQLTRVLARALAPEIRVNAIVPGTVLPPEDLSPAHIEALRARTPLGRIGSPADVARALAYLVAADYVTGELLVVDGGRMLA